MYAQMISFEFFLPAKRLIGPALFSMLVLMAIVTTVMTSPVFEWIYGEKARATGELDAIDKCRRKCLRKQLLKPIIETRV